MSNNQYSPTANSVPCKAKCRGGGKCICTGRAHATHICSTEGCECHQAQNYGLERVTLRNGREVYLPLARYQVVRV